MTKVYVRTSLEWRKTAENSYEMDGLGSSGHIDTIFDGRSDEDGEKSADLTQDTRFADGPWVVRIQSACSPYQTLAKTRRGNMTHDEALKWATDWLVQMSLDAL